MPPTENTETQDTEEIIEGQEDQELEGSEEGSTENDGAGSTEDSPEEIAEARRVYKLLQNPATAKNLVRELARAEGLLDASEPATNKEIKAGKASIKDILKEKLGDKYEFLIPQLSDALETILGNERETHQQSLQEIQVASTKRETADVLSKLAKETKGESRKLEPQMLALMEEFQIGPGVPIEKYLRGLYAQASSARNATTAKNRNNDLIRRNANDAPSRLQNSSSGTENNGSPNAGADPNKRLSVKEAVQLAVNQQTQQSRRK